MDRETASILAKALQIQNEQNGVIFMLVRSHHAFGSLIGDCETRFKANRDRLEKLIRELEGMATLP